ncbi:MAG: LytR C-terminal domain-containing protein [Phycisphaerae bacterium]|nr:LytR C-terminal domain-containing protein [Gemmatimonadaceae bacterium]
MNFPAPLPADGPLPLSRRKRVARFLVTLAVVAVAVTGASWWWSTREPGSPIGGAVGTAYAAQTDTLARAPKGVRIRVRVVNSTGINGLAKRATSILRDHGFDVVEYGSESRKAPRASTVVQTRAGQANWGDRIVRVLGKGALEQAADTSHLVDVTVLLGLDWKAPAQPFRP